MGNIEGDISQVTFSPPPPSSPRKRGGVVEEAGAPAHHDHGGLEKQCRTATLLQSICEGLLSAGHQQSRCLDNT
jgi:hypothetical protein